MQVIIETKRAAQYFRGNLRRCHVSNSWFVACESYAGGHRQVSPLDAICIKTNTKDKLIGKLKSLANRGKYTIKFIN